MTRPAGVEFTLLHPEAAAPSRAYEGDAGWDLYCLEDVIVPPGEYRDIKTGVAVALPPGWFLRLVARSSTFRKRGLMVLEGIIDAGFRGELFATVYNPSSGLRPDEWTKPGNQGPVDVKAGERLIQAIVQPFYSPTWTQVDKLPPSERGEAGFGSSG